MVLLYPGLLNGCSGFATSEAAEDMQVEGKGEGMARWERTMWLIHQFVLVQSSAELPHVAMKGFSTKFFS